MQLPEAQCLRLSFCCDREGCRKRVTPPSVRFLGRKVYLAAVMILINAMRQGPTPRRVRELSQRFKVDRRDHRSLGGLPARALPADTILEDRHARLTPIVKIVSLPYSLVDAFLRHRPPDVGWTRLLRFLSPITIALAA